MARTEFYIAKRNKGKWKFFGDVKMASTGAWNFWCRLEEKYLEPLPLTEFGSQLSRMYSVMNPDAKKDIWNLWYSPQITEAERLVLFTTFDDKYLPYEHIPEVVSAMREVHRDIMQSNSNFDAQADILEEIYNNLSIKEVKVVGINATSVSCHADIIGEKFDKDELSDLYADYLEGVEWAKKIKEEST